MRTRCSALSSGAGESFAKPTVAVVRPDMIRHLVRRRLVLVGTFANTRAAEHDGIG
jgi:hypothetical protein